MKNSPHKSIIIWLLSGCVLIFVMVVIGGVTRLTHSGLSMVDWNLFMGAIPPLNEKDWLDTFNQYKQYPEYQQVNFTFSLNEFKSIFFWEYLHRLIGRLIGLVFIIPFVYFLIKKRLSKKLIGQCLIILAMGGFQGAIGWWMVKSGLVNDPDVSHYRLATHLMAAFLTFAYTFWVALQLVYEKASRPNISSLRKWLWVLLIALLAQIIYGAFVAGLNAGFVMNTWPKMGDKWIADSVTVLKPVLVNFVDGIGGVQFIHRYLAYVVVLIVLVILFRSSKYDLDEIQKKALKIILIIVFTQFLLGVFTILYAVPVWLGVAHQVGAFVLLGTVIFALAVFKRN